MSDRALWPQFPIKRRLQPYDILFEDGDLACNQQIKSFPIEQHHTVQTVPEFFCCLSGCGESFECISSYESHYNTVHRNKCTVCKKIFPCNYLLDIHLLEWHDSMFEILAAKQNMYKCLSEYCLEKFKSSKSRKKHMIEKHCFPPNYRFDRTKKNTSAVPKKYENKKDENSVSMETEEIKPVQVNFPSSERIFSYKVPKNICFGQGQTKGFNRPRGRGGRHWHQSKSDKNTTINIENVAMTDLTDVLNSS